MNVIAGAVGQGGANQVTDVRVVQRLLNDWLARKGQTALKVDGLVGPKTIGAITVFQRANALSTDGRADVDGPTIKALFSQHLSGLLGAIDVSGVARYVDASAINDAALSDPTVTNLLQTYVGVLRKSA
jgi:peptidoglycan hydrolase-like protein with peptidoglycan-binding domain